MKHEAIRKALETHLAGTLGAPPISYENVPFTQPDGSYYASFLLPAAPEPVGRAQGETDVFNGIFQVTVCTVKDTGREPITTELDRLQARFPRSSALEEDGIRVIIHRVFANTAGADETHHRTPVSIVYKGI